MKTSISARGGRYIALTIHGDGPFVPDMLSRKGSQGLAVHHYAAKEGCELDDPRAWQAANPSLGTIKQRSYMVARARAAIAVSSDEPDFRAFDLNLPSTPGANPLCGIAHWKACEVEAVEDLPPREGKLWIGLDLGGHASMTAAALWWPETTRLEVIGAFPSKPMSLYHRGLRDGVGVLYEQMQEEGSVRVFDGNVTPVLPMLKWVEDMAAGQAVEYLCADRYRQKELVEALEKCELDGKWRARFTPVGAGPDGGLRRAEPPEGDRALFGAGDKVPAHAQRDTGKPRGVRQKWESWTRKGPVSLGRIDALQASVLAVGRARSDSVEGLSSTDAWLRAAERGGGPVVMGI